MAFAGLSDAAKEDLAVSLACLILHDGKVEVSADNINAVVAAAGVKVAPYWGSLMAKFLAGRDIDDMLLKPGMGGGPAPTTAAAPSGGAPSGGAAPKKEEKKEEEEEEVGGAGGLFGGGDDDW